MGLGESLEAAYSLRASVPAGTYHVQCDAIVTSAVDVRFSLIWRRGAMDTMLAQWTQHWEKLPGGKYDAQPYEIDVTAPKIDYKSGDELVFRYEDTGNAPPSAFIPNGDGARAQGRIPSIRLPR